MKRIILISGKAESGKDSVANILKEKLPGKTLIVHNADYLKYMCKQYLGWDGNKDDWGREILQFLGTNKIRAIHPTYWIERTCDVIDFLKDQYDYFLVPDTRFKNEIYYPKAQFPEKNIVVTLRIHRTDYTSTLTTEQKNHPSETDMDDFKFDYEIYSKSGLDNLEFQVNRIVSFLK